MPRPKSDDSTDATIRWRDRHETQIRLERLALFYDLPWNKLAASVLTGYASAQEKKHGLPSGPTDELPRAHHASVEKLRPLARARYDFYTAKLDALRLATSPEERKAIADREFVGSEWLTPREKDRAAASEEPVIVDLRGHKQKVSSARPKKGDAGLSTK